MSEQIKKDSVFIIVVLVLFIIIPHLFPIENVSICLRTGELWDGVIKGNFLFITSKRGVDIYDISNPSNPAISYYLDTPGLCNDISVYGNFLYTTDGPSGIGIYDITNPLNPSLISHFSSENNFKEIYVRDSIFCATTKPNGITIFKYKPGGNIEKVSRINLNYGVNGLFMKDSLLVAGLSNNNGFIIYDVGNVSNPLLLSHTVLNSPVNDITGKDTLVFLASGYSGIKVFNLTNPTSPESIGVYSNSDYILYLAVFDTLLYLAGLYDSVYVLNITNPSNPSLTNTIKTTTIPTHSFSNGNVLYVAETKTGELFSSNGYNKFANLDSLYPVVNGCISGSFAYVAVKDKGLVILDITNPFTPNIVSTYDSLKDIKSIYVRNSIAYLSCGLDGLYILDVSNPYNPTVVSSYNTPGILYSIAKKGEIVFLADGGDGIIAVSIENISNPVMLDSLHLPGYTYDIAIADTIAFVALGNNGFGIINITNPQNISLLDTTSDTGFSKTITTNGNFLFIGTISNGIKVYDVSNPNSPSYINTYPVSAPVNDVMYENNLLFCGCNVEGIRVLDVSNPYNPVNFDSLDTPGILSNIGPSRFGIMPVADYFSFRLDSSFLDTVPPSPVTNLMFEAGDSLILLKWLNAKDLDYCGTRLLYKNDTFSTNPSDGTVLMDHAMEPNSPDSFCHTGLAGDSTHYYYSVFTYDFSGNFSSPAFISGISASDTIPPSDVTIDSFGFWSDTIEVFFTTPNDTDFVGVRVMYDTTHIPQNIHDGTLFFDTTLLYNSHFSKRLGSVTINKTYYFSFFSKDPVPNFSSGISDSFQTYTDTFPPDTIKQFSATKIIPDTIKLRWINPVTSDLQKIVIRYSKYNFPSLPDSGNQLWTLISNPADTVTKLWVSNSFTPGVRYYFSGFSVDKSGNTSTGSHTSCLTPKLIKVWENQPPEPTEGGFATWLDSVEVSFTAPVQITTLQTGVEIKGRYNYSFRIEREGNKRYIFIPPAFSALDTITVTLKNIIIDSVGNPFDGNGNGIPDSVDNYSWYFYTGLLGDYTGNDTVNSEDFAIFKNAYLSQDITKETGPCTGSIPYYLLIPDSIMDFEDFSTFIMMWNWSLDHRGIPHLDTNINGSLLQFEKSNNCVIIKTKKLKGLISGEILLKGINDSLMPTRGSGLSDSDVFIVRSNNNEQLISFGIMGNVIKNSDIAVIPELPSQKRIEYSYRLVFNNSKEEGKGYFLPSISAPEQTILKSIYPNPGGKINIIYGIPRDMAVRIDIFDVAGRKISTLCKGKKQAGYHTIIWNGKGDAKRLPAGIYFIRLKTEKLSIVKTLILLR